MGLNRATSAVQHSKTKIFFYEDTGVYDASGNPGGYGSGTTDPNPDISDIADIGDTKGIVIMLEHSSGTYTWDDTAEIQLRGWPNTINQKLVLEASSFGLTDFPDGKMTITSRVSGEFTYNDGSGDVVEGFSAEDSIVIYNTKKVECCVETMALQVTVKDMKEFCDDVYVKRFNKASLYLERIKLSAMAGRYSEADEHLQLLEEFCQTEAGNCGC